MHFHSCVSRCYAAAGITCPQGETCVADYYTYSDELNNIITVTTCPANETCSPVPWYEIVTAAKPPVVADEDFDFAAAFLAAAADKTGEISTDMVVYINSILEINTVVGYSAYDAKGNPADGAIDYSINPIYFNYSGVILYDRGIALGARGLAQYLKETSLVTWEQENIAVSAIPGAVSAVPENP